MEISQLLNHLREHIDVRVRSGYGSDTDVLTRIEEQVRDELRNTDGAEVEGLLAEARAGLEQQRRRERTWAEATTNDHIDEAFDALAELGVIALQNAGYTMSDGWSDVAEAQLDQPDAWGGTFFHGQDVESGVRGGGLLLAFGAFADGPEREGESLRLAKMICEELNRCGVATKWDGTIRQRISIPAFEWRKRRHSRRGFTLNVGGSEERLGARSLTRVLGAVAREEEQFLVLSHAGSRSFVQAAGVDGELTVEWRVNHEDGFTHVRLCRPDGSEERRPPAVPGYRGYRDKEVLSVAQALAIFESFITTGSPPRYFEQRDMAGELGG